jgi:PAS domain S-box-containing protein
MKRPETDAEHLNTLYKNAVHEAMDSIMVTAPDLDEPGPEIIYVNPAFTRMTGYDSQEAIGRSPRFLQGKNTDRQILRKVGRLLRKGQPVREEITNYRKDGKEYVIEWHIAPVREIEKIVNWVSVQRDITERKRLERQLEQEKLAVEEKVKERTKELEDLKTRLSEYAGKLELRLSHLEKRQSGLSERERRVLAAIARKPEATDTENAGFAGIKRPTFTSIRKRLENRAISKVLYVPDPQAIGYEAVAFEFGELTDIQRKTRHIEERIRKRSVFYIASKTHYAAITFCKSYSEAYRMKGSIFPAEYLRFSFGAGIASLFGIKPEWNKSAGRIDDLELMRALVEHPSWSARSIADHLGLSATTVINARRKLLESAALRKDIMPRLKGYDIVLLHTESPDESVHSFMKIESPRECIYMGWVKEEVEHGISFGASPKIITSFANALDGDLH